jgi:hypothetical protein
MNFIINHWQAIVAFIGGLGTFLIWTSDFVQKILGFKNAKRKESHDLVQFMDDEMAKKYRETVVLMNEIIETKKTEEERRVYLSRYIVYLQDILDSARRALTDHGNIVTADQLNYKSMENFQQ